MRRRQVETRGDRVTLARDAGMGQASLLSVLAGTLVAYGAFAVLLSITAAVAKAVGIETDLNVNEWRQLGVAGGLVVAVVLLLCYLFGGYVAGRMARRSGITNGFLVFLLSLVMAVGVTLLVNLFTDGEDILRQLRNVGVPTSSDEWGDVGTVAGIGSLVAMLLGAVAGGILGERWHGKLLARAFDPGVGPEADARAQARAEAAEREERQVAQAARDDAGAGRDRAEDDRAEDDRAEDDRAEDDRAAGERRDDRRSEWAARDDVIVREGRGEAQAPSAEPEGPRPRRTRRR